MVKKGREGSRVEKNLRENCLIQHDILCYRTVSHDFSHSALKAKTVNTRLLKNLFSVSVFSNKACFENIINLWVNKFPEIRWARGGESDEERVSCPQ